MRNPRYLHSRCSALKVSIYELPKHELHGHMDPSGAIAVLAFPHISFSKTLIDL